MAIFLIKSPWHLYDEVNKFYIIILTHTAVIYRTIEFLEFLKLLILEN